MSIYLYHIYLLFAMIPLCFLQDVHKFLVKSKKTIRQYRISLVCRFTSPEFAPTSRRTQYYSGTPTELSALLSEQSADNFSNRIISKNFTLLTHNLENVGIMWSSYRSNGQRMIEIIYESVDSDVKTAVQEFNDTIGTMLPQTPLPKQSADTTRRILM